jgi:hypothetical protein
MLGSLLLGKLPATARGSDRRITKVGVAIAFSKGTTHPTKKGLPPERGSLGEELLYCKRLFQKKQV